MLGPSGLLYASNVYWASNYASYPLNDFEPLMPQSSMWSNIFCRASLGWTNNHAIRWNYGLSIKLLNHPKFRLHQNEPFYGTWSFAVNCWALLLRRAGQNRTQSVWCKCWCGGLCPLPTTQVLIYTAHLITRQLPHTPQRNGVGPSSDTWRAASH
jgi:hypothetical protein